MTKKIENREDIYQLVKLFYVKLLNDDKINHFFAEMVENDGLEKHLQVLVNFWDNLLFQTGAYKRNAMMPHLILNKKIPFLAENFKTWLHHFNDSVDELFEGDLAHAAKTRALSIATVMEMRVNGY